MTRQLVEQIRRYADGTEQPDYWTLLSTAALAAIELEQMLDRCITPAPDQGVA